MTPSATTLIRRATVEDIVATFEVRAHTRENAISRERLHELGITPKEIEVQMLAGQLESFVAVVDGQVVGFCNGVPSTGEIHVLAVRDGYERRGLGRGLLAAVMDVLVAHGHRRLFLYTSPRSDWRAFRVYRDHGWAPTGEALPNGDERLEWLVPVDARAVR